MANHRCDRMQLDEFVKLIKEIIFTEREVESAKIELSLKSDFNITDAFNQVDISRTGKISQGELTDALKRNLYFLDFTSDDIQMLFRRFNRRNSGYICFNDFSRIMLPFSREYADLVTDRIDYYSRRTNDGFNFFKPDTRHEM